MLHNEMKSPHTDKLTKESLHKCLLQYQIEAMKKINARRKSGHLVDIQSLLEKYTVEEIKIKFNNSIEGLLKTGFTNSPHLVTIKEHTYRDIPSLPHEVIVPVFNTYILASSSKPTEVLFDLLEEASASNSITIVNDDYAINIMFYYSLLKVLQNFMGKKEGENLFNEIFGSLKSKMLIEQQLPHFVKRETCALANRITRPYFNILTYFLEVKEGKLIAGDVINFTNNSYYPIKNPWGRHDAYTLLCAKEGKNKQHEFIGYQLGKTMNEDAIRQLALNEYNDCPQRMGEKWKESLSKEKEIPTVEYPETIKKSQVPGFKETGILRFDLEKVLDLIKFPHHMLKKLSFYLEIELAAISQARKYAISLAYQFSESALYENLLPCLPPLPISPQQKLVEEDDVILFECIIYSMFSEENRNFDNGNYEEAMVALEVILRSSRVVCHYCERLSLSKGIDNSLLMISRCCFQIAMLLKKNNKEEISKQYFLESEEILKKLYGNDYYKVEWYPNLAKYIAEINQKKPKPPSHKKKNAARREKRTRERGMRIFEKSLLERENNKAIMISKAASKNPHIMLDRENFDCHLDTPYFKNRYESEYLPQCHFFSRTMQMNPRMPDKLIDAKASAKNQSRLPEALDLAKARKFRKEKMI